MDVAKTIVDPDHWDVYCDECSVHLIGHHWELTIDDSCHYLCDGCIKLLREKVDRLRLLVI